MADANRTQLGMVEETVFGVTPTANLDILRITGGGFTPSQNTVTSEEIRADLRAGQPVRTSQMATASVNAEFSYGTWDKILEGMMLSAYSSDVLVDGTTLKSYTFEDQFLGLGTPLYNTYRGSRIASVNIELGLDAIVSANFGVMSAGVSLGNTASAGSANNATTSSAPWNTVDMIERLSYEPSGTTMQALGRVVGITLNIERSLREKREFGNINPFDIGVGRLLVSGQIQRHFLDDTFIDGWAQFADRSLAVEFKDEDDNEFLIEIPKLKLTGDLNVENPGVDTDRLVTANFEAYATASDPALIRFTRTDG